MKMKKAITRAVSPAINQCELTHIDRAPIDYDNAVKQHHAYEGALRQLGVEVIALPAEATLPDSVFVEDTAIVLPECAILTNPGAESRRPEVESVAQALAPYRSLHRITPPGLVDGGDVLVLNKDVYVGHTTRSNAEAVSQMQSFLQPHGYRVHLVEVTGCLHLKTAVTQVSKDTLLLNPAWVNEAVFTGWKALHVHPDEPFAANAVLVDDAIIYPQAFPHTEAMLRAAGIRMITVPADELAKAEGAVTCCSLLFEVDA